MGNEEKILLAVMKGKSSRLIKDWMPEGLRRSLKNCGDEIFSESFKKNEELESINERLRVLSGNDELLNSASFEASKIREFLLDLMNSYKGIGNIRSLIKTLQDDFKLDSGTVNSLRYVFILEERIKTESGFEKKVVSNFISLLEAYEMARSLYACHSVREIDIGFFAENIYQYVSRGDKLPWYYMIGFFRVEREEAMKKLARIESRKVSENKFRRVERECKEECEKALGSAISILEKVEEEIAKRKKEIIEAEEILKILEKEKEGLSDEVKISGFCSVNNDLIHRFNEWLASLGMIRKKLVEEEVDNMLSD